MLNCVLLTSFYDLVLSKVIFSQNFLFFSFFSLWFSSPLSNPLIFPLPLPGGLTQFYTGLHFSVGRLVSQSVTKLFKRRFKRFKDILKGFIGERVINVWIFCVCIREISSSESSVPWVIDYSNPPGQVIRNNQQWRQLAIDEECNKK